MKISNLPSVLASGSCHHRGGEVLHAIGAKTKSLLGLVPREQRLPNPQLASDKYAVLAAPDLENISRHEGEQDGTDERLEYAE